MCKKWIHPICIIAVFSLAVPSSYGRVLVQDDFEGATLDLAKWQLVEAAGATISQGDGAIFFNRPSALLCYFATADEFDPAVTPLTITGSCTLGSDADIDVWTRADLVGNAGGGPGHVLNSGIRINFWQDAVDSGYPPNLDILEKTAGVWPWDSSISEGTNIPGDDEALDWDFVITDDGTIITATFTQTSDPNNTLSLTGISTTHFDTNYIAFTVVNGYLNDVTITTTKGGTMASHPDPVDEAPDVFWEVVLSWTPGEFAATHDVYLGTSFDDVNAASVSNPLDVLVGPDRDANTYDPPGRLEFSQTYYWRVDEVNAPPNDTVFPGEVWSFTVEPFTYPVENVTATASCPSDMGVGPEKTVDGSGLYSDGTHSTDDQDMWLGTPVDDEPVWIQYDFDLTYRLDAMHLWNFNGTWEAALGFSLKDITVEYTIDGANWTNLGDFELAQGTGKIAYAGQSISLGGIAAKAVRITVISNYGGGSFGLSEVRFDSIPTHARFPEPASGTTSVGLNPLLSWRPGREAVSHQVSLSKDEQAVADGAALVDTITGSSYPLASLDLGTTYYWRVDEINEAEAVSTWAGHVWSFTTRTSLTLEDFESYTADRDADQAIFQTWMDGYGDGTNGSIVGHDDPPYVEQVTIHGGKQAMPLYYDNGDTAGSSETERLFDIPQDWTRNGAMTLALYFYGGPDNDANEPMWVRLTDQNGTRGQVIYGSAADEDTNNQATAAWSKWSIPLASFGVNAAEIEAIAIGFGDAGPRSAGLMLFDDICLEP